MTRVYLLAIAFVIALATSPSLSKASAHQQAAETNKNIIQNLVKILNRLEAGHGKVFLSV